MRGETDMSDVFTNEAEEPTRDDGVRDETVLSDEEVRVIAQAAQTDRYLSSPVPDDLREQLPEGLTGVLFMPSVAKSNLLLLYGPGKNALAMLDADWREARRQGSVRLFKEKTVSFPTRVAHVNGSGIEVSISMNARQEGLPWVLTYVPSVATLKLRRDQPVRRGPAERPSQFGDPLPPLLEREMEAMKRTDDYLTGALPSDLMDEVLAFSGEFSKNVWISQRWEETIAEYAGADIDAVALLDRDWEAACRLRALRCYEGKVQFPISIKRGDGASLMEASIKRDAMAGRPGSLPWHLCYVDKAIHNKVVAGRALTDWAYLGNWQDVLSSLASIVLPERWGFEGEDDGGDTYPILKNYLTYTFYRLRAEGKVLEDPEKGIAAFNTGLVDRTYEPIYACFSPANLAQPWRFEAFCRAGSRNWGKRLVGAFNPLPARAEYFTRKEDLLFDTDRTLQRDVDHILIDNMDRLPKDFLAEEMRTDPDALEVLEEAFGAVDSGERARAFDELREILEDDVKIKRRLINRLDDAIELACKRVEWNFKTAVPAFYPTRNTMSLLLPLDLTEDGQPDVALVVELVDSGAYIGQTILTMKMAYNNARLISRPDSDWLNTSLRLAAFV